VSFKLGGNNNEKLWVVPDALQEKNMSKKNIGSNFDEYLSENAILDEATAVAVKRVI